MYMKDNLNEIYIFITQQKHLCFLNKLLLHIMMLIVCIDYVEKNHLLHLCSSSPKVQSL
jgi:hypothetical protein